MPHDTLFGHLAFRAPKPENVATEALCFILGRSAAVREALLAVASDAGVELPADLHFQTQVTGEEGERPDLVGTDADGDRRFIIEAKFWAGLTENQPETYLRSMPTDKPSLLLFVAPATRCPTLWPKLLKLSGGDDAESAQGVTSLATHRLDAQRTLAIISWRALLRRLGTDAENTTIEDIRQLEGLCERMDSEEFLPISQEELTGRTGRRVYQYCELADTLGQLVAQKPWGSTNDVRLSSGQGWCGRYCRIHGYACCIYFSASAWADDDRETPLWLSIKEGGKKWRYSETARKCLTATADGREAIDFVDREADGYIAVPLYLPTGLEQDDVLEGLMTQLKRVAARLGETPRSDLGTPTADSSDEDA